MNTKELLNKILFYISVPKCISCGEILDKCDAPLCEECYRKYEEIKESECSECFNKIGRCTCSNPFMQKHFIKQACKVYRYRRNSNNDIGNKLIYSLKQDNRRDVIEFLAGEVTNSIVGNGIPALLKNDYIITSVPRRKNAIRNFGYDHAELLARAVAKNFGVTYSALLVSKTKKAQKEVTSDERFANAKVDYKNNINCDINGKHVIIVDDIVTTGSSMSACASLIRGLGAKSITAACVAIAYMDEYTPFKAKD